MIIQSEWLNTANLEGTLTPATVQASGTTVWPHTQCSWHLFLQRGYEQSLSRANNNQLIINNKMYSACTVQLFSQLQEHQNFPCEHHLSGHRTGKAWKITTNKEQWIINKSNPCWFNQVALSNKINSPGIVANSQFPPSYREYDMTTLWCVNNMAHKKCVSFIWMTFLGNQWVYASVQQN